MNVFMQLLFNGLIAGGIYALVAVGFSLIYSTNRFIHFAHGAVIAFSAYFLYLFFNMLKIPFFVSILLTLFFASLLGWVIFVFVYNPLKKRNASNVILLIASTVLLLLIENLILLFFGADVKAYGFISVSKGMNILGALVTPLQIVIFGVSVLLLLVLFFIVKKTSFGRKLRAVADNPKLADISGISSIKVQSLSFLIGSFIAGVAGILIGLEQNLEPVMGTSLMIKGFTGAIIGGVGSIPGAVLGSYLLGLVENFGIWYLPSGYKDAIAFVLLFVFLLFKPNGILGIKKGVKK